MPKPIPKSKPKPKPTAKPRNCHLCFSLGKTVVAGKYCANCKQDLCCGCSENHLTYCNTALHDMVEIQMQRTNAESNNHVPLHCNMHIEEEIDMYCMDCKVGITSKCHKLQHRTHDCKVLRDTVEAKQKSMWERMSAVKECREKLSSTRVALKFEEKSFLENVTSAEKTSLQKVSEFRALVDSYERTLLSELNQIKVEGLRELADLNEEFHVYDDSLESIIKQGEKLIECQSDVHISDVGETICSKAEELILAKENCSWQLSKKNIEFMAASSAQPVDLKQIIGKFELPGPPVPTEEQFRRETVTEPPPPPPVRMMPVNKRLNSYQKVSSTGYIRPSTREHYTPLSSLWKKSTELALKNSTRGVTAVDNAIFVLLSDRFQVTVYDARSLRESRTIPIPDMKSPAGLAGCSHNKVLYISDSWLECIHRVDLIKSSVTRWKLRTKHEPRGLSVTAEHTLLVTVQISDTGGESRVLEYMTKGQQIREIRFDRYLRWAYQTVQLTTDHYIISHGLFSPLHRVCLIKSDGRVIKSYGRERGKGEGQLSEPYSVAIDGVNKHIYVADGDNNRILVLDDNLNYLNMVNIESGFKKPLRLHFDSLMNKLYVSEEFSERLIIIDLV